ncbi:S41 family peptidase [Flagellimonas sp. 2504JD1-5]
MKRTFKGLVQVFILFVLVNVIAQDREVGFHVKGFPDSAAGFMGIRGDTHPLSWDSTILIKDGHLTVKFPDSVTQIEYKYVIDKNGVAEWEGIQNRLLKLDDEKLLVNDIWNKETPVDITMLPNISSKELLEDFKLIKTMVLEVHPGTYRYNSSTSINNALTELQHEFQKKLSIGEAYLAMSKLTAALQCDHTKVGFNNQTRYVNTVIHEQKDKLPFTFRWFNDKMVVEYSAATNPLLKKGTQVLSINGHEVGDIKRSLMSYVAADGATDLNRESKLEVDGYDFRYNAFDIFFPLKFPSDKQKFDLKIKNGNKIDSISVDGIHREERASILGEKYSDFPKNRDAMWNFELEGNVGILTLNSFGLYGWKAMRLDYKQFLTKAFDVLNQKKVANLIVDIRKNTGGNDEMADELFSYLSDSSFNFEREGRTRYLNFPETMKPHIQTWGDNPWYYKLNPRNNTSMDGYYIFKENFKPSKKNHDKNTYKGKLTLLVGPTNTSLAFYVANRFKLQRLGVMIGEETGGNLNDINGGQILFLRLPNSGIEIDFPVMGGFTNSPQPNSGVIPDIVVKENIKDFLSNRDAVLEKAMELIHEN